MQDIREKIYAIEAPELGKMIALYVTLNYMGFKGIGFTVPGSRGHLIKGKMGRKTKTGFVFHSTNEAYPGDWKFTEVTYENFKSVYCKDVESGEDILAEVHNTQELQDWYHEHFPE